MTGGLLYEMPAKNDGVLIQCATKFELKYWQHIVTTS